MGRGRPKGSKNKEFSNYPTNLDCWRFVLSNPENVSSFIKRGDERQHSEIRCCLNYWKKNDEYFYQRIDGDNILKQLKKEN